MNPPSRPAPADAAELPMAELMARLATTLDGLAGRTAQMQQDLSRFLDGAGHPSDAQLRELQGLDLIHQTLDDLRAAAHLAAESSGADERICVATLAGLLRLESCRIALLSGGETALEQEQPPGDIHLF
ncbi:hypothetical protein [Vannielia sp.]|uniref:hypothetical protein n=1 Tax=Vannielia sp. TaxID=2813045 RepID=UPI0026231C03|nr:hypothetical protein [Vannielia sp.]MDF1872053.1 hypothetical protein [Vannielia sp.]